MSDNIKIMTWEELHEIYTPSSECPILIVQKQGSAALNEERYEDLDPLNDHSDIRVREQAAPYLKVPSLACVLLEKLARRFPICCGCIVLNV